MASTPGSHPSPPTWLAGLAGTLLIGILATLGATVTGLVGKTAGLEARVDGLNLQLDRMEKKLDRLLKIKE